MTRQSEKMIPTKTPHRAFVPPHRRTAVSPRLERDVVATARDICEQAQKQTAHQKINQKTGTIDQTSEDEQARVRDRIEHRLVSAAWTLRRLPDRERGFLTMRTMLWPDTASAPGTYARSGMTALQARRSMRIEPADIDAMQPTLDLLLLLPDVLDRQILFWAAWHQDGEPQAKLPWAKIRRSLGVDLSRWSLKRRNDAGLAWLARLVLLQKTS